MQGGVNRPDVGLWGLGFENFEHLSEMEPRFSRGFALPQPSGVPLRPPRTVRAGGPAGCEAGCRACASAALLGQVERSPGDAPTARYRLRVIGIICSVWAPTALHYACAGADNSSKTLRVRKRWARIVGNLAHPLDT